MQILAHRTAMANAPPNSLQGFHVCHREGVKIIECDVNFTFDGRSVIWNDADRHRLSKSVFSVDNYTLEELTNLKRKDSNEPLLGVNGVLFFLRNHPECRVLFDIKYHHEDLMGIILKIPSYFIRLTIQEVIGPAIAMKLTNQIGFVTFEGGARLLKAAKESSRDIQTNLIVVRPWVGISRHLEYLDGVTVGWGWRGRNHWWLCPGRVERLVEEVKKSGRKIWGGLARNYSHIEWLQYHGFEGVWVDDIVMARSVLESEI